jgi:hypothetical protein
MPPAAAASAPVSVNPQIDKTREAAPPTSETTKHIEAVVNKAAALVEAKAQRHRISRIQEAQQRTV